jgi:septum formation protein
LTTPLPSFILASASPRRREILSALGVRFEVVVPDIQELTEGDPERVVLENARRKARAVNDAPEGVPVLGVDTEVVVDGRVLGKPRDRAAARTRLEKLSGRAHEVLGGVVVLAGARAEERSGVARCEVTFRALDESIIEMYLDSGEWRDRAGAYAIQGLGSVLVERIEGDLANVIGLPLRRLLDLAPELFVNAGDSA